MIILFSILGTFLSLAGPAAGAVPLDNDSCEGKASLHAMVANTDARMDALNTITPSKMGREENTGGVRAAGVSISLNGFGAGGADLRQLASIQRKIWTTSGLPNHEAFCSRIRTRARPSPFPYVRDKPFPNFIFASNFPLATRARWVRAPQCSLP